MTDVLGIAHPQNCPPYGNSRVGICEGNLICWLAIGDMIWKMIYQLFCIWGDCYGISAKGIVKNFVLTCWRASPPRYNQRSIYQLTGKEKS